MYPWRLRARPTNDQVQQSLPVIWVVFLLVHYNGFKHGAFTHHKLYHSVNKDQQIPVDKQSV